MSFAARLSRSCRRASSVSPTPSSSRSCRRSRSSRPLDEAPRPKRVVQSADVVGMRQMMPELIAVLPPRASPGAAGTGARRGVNVRSRGTTAPSLRAARAGASSDRVGPSRAARPSDRLGEHACGGGPAGARSTMTSRPVSSLRRHHATSGYATARRERPFLFPLFKIRI